MNAGAVAALVIATAVGTGIVARAFQTDEGKDARIDDVSAEMQRVHERLDAFEERVAGLTRGIEEATARAAAPSARIAAAASEDTAAGEASRTTGNGAPADEAGAGAASGDAAAEFDLDATLDQLLDGGPWEGKEELWRQILAAGKADEVIAALKDRIEQDPDDPELRVHLGSAYLQKIFTVADGPQKGIYAMEADRAFDAALAIDPRHWTARFSKAMSLSFWPPLFGKQAEAISQFETLVYQQEEQGGNTKPQFAQTYVFLGNLYQQQGNAQKAQETWAKGAALFPGYAELQKKLQ